MSTGLPSRRTPRRQHSANKYGVACHTPSKLLNTVPNVPMRNSHLPRAELLTEPVGEHDSIVVPSPSTFTLCPTMTMKMPNSATTE